MADAPLAPFTIIGRAPADLAKSGGGSALPFGHCPFVGGLLREAEFCQLPGSAAPGMAFPPGGGLEVTVDTDEFDAVDETDEDEFVRWSGLRGMNMLIPLPSSEFIALRDWPPLIHPARLRFARLGGLATAVMENSRWG